MSETTTERAAETVEAAAGAAATGNGHGSPNGAAGAVRAPIRWDYSPAPESTDHVRLRDRYGLFIGGEFVEADAYAPTVNPATEEPLAEIAQASAADVARAVDAARAAAPAWAALSGLERGKYVFRIARLIQERARELAVVETL